MKSQPTLKTILIICVFFLYPYLKAQTKTKQLFDFVKEKKITSVDDIAKTFDSLNFPLFSVQVLSKSLQTALPPKDGKPFLPRVNLSNLDSTFLISFNGGGAGSNSLDIFEYVPEQNRYVPSVLEFGSQENEYGLNVPDKCASCHFTKKDTIGTHPHPSFISMDLNPRILGSLKGAMSKTESKILADFLSSGQSFPRYDLIKKRLSEGENPGTVGYQMGREIFENLFATHAEDLRAQKNDQGLNPILPYRYALVASLVCKNLDIHKVIPSSVLSDFENNFDQTRDSLLKVKEFRFNSELKIWKEINKIADDRIQEFKVVQPSTIENNYDFITQNILNPKFGVTPNSDWFARSLVYENDEGRISNLAPYLTRTLFVSILDLDLAKKFEDISKSRKNRTERFSLGEQEEQICSELNARSLKSLGE